MNIAIRVVILFLIIFSFRIPVLYNTTFLSILLSTCYYLYTRRAIPFDFFWHKYNFIVLGGLLVTCVICLGITIFHHQYDIVMLKVLLVQLSMLGALVYALPILIPKGEEGIAFERSALIICYTFALQGIIQLSGFFIPSWGEFLVEMKGEGVAKQVLTGYENLYFRGYALTGSPFFELPSAFGVAFILFFRLLLVRGYSFFPGYISYIIFILFFLGSMFSGRTAFVGLAIALIMCVCILKNPGRIVLSVLKNMAVVIFFAILLFQFLPKEIKLQIEEDVLPFAFEFYYNYTEKGELKTASSDVMLNAHYFLPKEETLLIGDGRYMNKTGNNYMYTDAGYMRAVLYGGGFFFLWLVLYQSLYFIRPMTRSYLQRKNVEDYSDFLCFLFLFGYLFFLEFKSEAIGRQNITMVLLLFIGCAYMVRDCYRFGNEK